jgi:hypothetical protein
MQRTGLSRRDTYTRAGISGVVARGAMLNGGCPSSPYRSPSWDAAFGEAEEAEAAYMSRLNGILEREDRRSPR